MILMDFLVCYEEILFKEEDFLVLNFEMIYLKLS